jgi:sodium-dependent dicarboxylate transporter 2/3/5
MSPRRIKPVALAAGLAVFAGILLAAPDSRAARAGAVAALMAVWWIGEALPIHWTACAPLLLFPLLDVFGSGWLSALRQSALPYLDPYIFLFAGGMAIAAAMQQWNLHRRIALAVMRAIGVEPARLLLGSLAATAFVSLWISNTATAAMMFPIGLAVIGQLEAQAGGRRLAHFGMAIMLSIAYGSNVGGIGTKIGTAPNALFSGFLERMGQDITFFQFMAVGLPFVLMFLPVVWLALWRIGRRDELGDLAGGEAVEREWVKLGPVAPEERWVLGVFLATAVLWMAGKPLTDLVRGRFPTASAGHVEGGIAVAAALVLMALRPHGAALLQPRSLRRVPWSALVLLGGGFALAAGVQGSGLSRAMAERLYVLGSLPPFSQLLLASLVTVAISAVASNTATITIMLVVLRDAASPEIVTPVLFAATIASSCDFALPAGTPPNAIVFGSGYVTIPRMARTGAILDLLAALLAAAWCWAVVPLVL